MQHRSTVGLGLLCLTLLSIAKSQWAPQYAGLPGGLDTKQLQFAAVDANVCWAMPVVVSNSQATYIKTTNGGLTWIASTVPDASGNPASSVTAVDAQNAWIVFAEGSTGSGVYRTTNGGVSWTHQASAFPSGSNPRFVKFFDAGNGLAVGNPNGGYWEIYTTTDGGMNWARVTSANIPAPLSGETAYVGGVPASYGDNLWFSTNQQSVYRTSNKGLNWTVSRNAYPGAIGMGLAFKDSLNGLLSGDGPNIGFRRTTDGGDTWTQVSAPSGVTPSYITAVPGTQGSYVASSYDLFGWNRGSAYTMDDGTTWTTIDNRNHGRSVFLSPSIGWSGGGNDSLYRWIGTIFVDLWNSQYSGIDTKQLFFAAVDSNICWATPVNDAASQGRYIRTTNGGLTWIVSVVPGATGARASGITAVDAHRAWIVFGDWSNGGGVYATTSGGVSWTRQISAFPSGGEPRYIKFFDALNGLVVGSPNGGYWEIYTTSDGGTNWIRVPTGNIPAPLSGEFGHFAGAPVSCGNTFWFATSQQSIYKSTNRGLTWTVARNVFPGAVGFCLAFHDTLNGLAGSDNPLSVRRTTDGGATWTLVSTPSGITPAWIAPIPGAPKSYVASSFDLFGWNPGSAYTRDNGTTWTTIDRRNHGRSIFLSPSIGWAGGGNDSLYAWDKTGYGASLLPVKESLRSLPSAVLLEQNYPNPFNPSTVVSYQLSVASDVKLAVYDILGREMATLVNEWKEPGVYTAQFDASGLATGVYLYRLTAGQSSIVRKMMVMK